MKLGFLAFAVTAGVVLFNVAIYAGLFLGAASLATSGIKAATNSCGHEYKIEKLPIAGSLFCTEK